MPRRHPPRSGGPPPVGTAPGWPQAQAWPDGRWLVRTVPGTSAVKPYRCPGCDQEIAAGVGHLVAWPADDEGSSADRRHWHTSCWQARLRRGPTRRG